MPKCSIKGCLHWPVSDNREGLILMPRNLSRFFWYYSSLFIWQGDITLMEVTHFLREKTILKNLFIFIFPWLLLSIAFKVIQWQLNYKIHFLVIWTLPLGLPLVSFLMGISHNLFYLFTWPPSDAVCITLIDWEIECIARELVAPKPQRSHKHAFRSVQRDKAHAEFEKHVCRNLVEFYLNTFLGLLITCLPQQIILSH